MDDLEQADGWDRVKGEERGTSLNLISQLLFNEFCIVVRVLQPLLNPPPVAGLRKKKQLNPMAPPTLAIRRKLKSI